MVLGVWVAFLQAYFLVDAIQLHTHGTSASSVIADLPAEYHHHDYKFVPQGDARTFDVHECLGCRLERTASLPTSGPSDVWFAAHGLRWLPESPWFTPAPFDRYRLPRAPPHA